MSNNAYGVTIKETYKDYSPPVSARKTVSRLLSGIPNTHLFGLKAIVLTNSGSISGERKRKKTRYKKKKVLLSDCRGLYHQKWSNEPAWIELFVDNICNRYPSWLLKIRFFSDSLFSEVLFHELGHHIHKTQVPEHKEREDIAEKWEKTLNQKYFRRRYWYLMLFLFPVWLLLKLFKKM